MALRDSSGNVLNQAALQAKTTTKSYPTDRVFTENVFEDFSYRNTGENNYAKGRKIKWSAGQVVTQAEIDGKFVAGTVTSVTPNSGVAAAGGATITVVGTNLDGVTAITVGGVAATNVKVRSNTKVTFTAPARSAGAQALVVTTPAGNATGAGNVTYV